MILNRPPIIIVLITRRYSDKLYKLRFKTIINEPLIHILRNNHDHRIVQSGEMKHTCLPLETTHHLEQTKWADLFSSYTRVYTQNPIASIIANIIHWNFIKTLKHWRGGVEAMGSSIKLTINIYNKQPKSSLKLFLKHPTKLKKGVVMCRHTEGDQLDNMSSTTDLIGCLQQQTI